MLSKIRILVIILAAGRGSRLRPLTYLIPKPILPISLSKKVIDYSLISANKLNYYYNSKTCISTSYKSNIIKKYISRKYGINNYFDTKLDEGSGIIIYSYLSEILDFNPKHVIIMPCDHIHNLPLKDILKSHLKNGNDMTIISKISNDSRHDYLKLKNDIAIVKYNELHQLSLACTGNYVFKFQALLNHIKQFKNPTHLDLGEDIVRPMLSTCKVGAYEHTGYWEDIGTWKRYFKYIILRELN